MEGCFGGRPEKRPSRTLDKGLAKERDIWRAKIMGKTSDLREQGKGDVKLERKLK